MKIDRAFDDAGRDQAECERLALPPDDREEGHRGADAREGDDELEHRADLHAGVAAKAQHPGRVTLECAVQGERGDRDEGDEVEDAGDERGPAHGLGCHIVLLDLDGLRLVSPRWDAVMRIGSVSSVVTSFSRKQSCLEDGHRRQPDHLMASQCLEEWLESAGDDAVDGVMVDLDIRDSRRPLDLASRRGSDEGDLDAPYGLVVEHAGKMGPPTGRPNRPDYVSDA